MGIVTNDEIRNLLDDLPDLVSRKGGDLEHGMKIARRISEIVEDSLATQEERVKAMQENTGGLADQVVDQLSRDSAIPHNWAVVDTGGGCTAFRYELSNDCYALLTDDGGCNVPQRGQLTLLGFYNYDGSETEECSEFSSLELALVAFETRFTGPRRCVFCGALIDETAYHGMICRRCC